MVVVVLETARFLFGACWLFFDFIADALHFLAVSDTKYDKVGKAISHFVHILAAFLTVFTVFFIRDYIRWYPVIATELEISLLPLLLASIQLSDESYPLLLIVI